MSLNADVIIYYLLPFSAAFKKLLKEGFSEWSLCSSRTLACVSLRQSSSLILPPGVASHITAFWSIIESSPGTVRCRCRYLLFHTVHQTQLPLGPVPAETETQPNRPLFWPGTGKEGPGQSRRCTVPCWQSWRRSAGLPTCSDPRPYAKVRAEEQP